MNVLYQGNYKLIDDLRCLKYDFRNIKETPAPQVDAPPAIRDDHYLLKSEDIENRRRPIFIYLSLNKMLLLILIFMFLIYYLILCIKFVWESIKF